VSLRNNTLYNLLGGAAPTVTALVTVPPLLAKIGPVRFGVLALVWLLVGHFAVFDFGLSRATANRMARLAGGAPAARRQLLWTSLWLNLAFGVLGACSLYALSEPFVLQTLGIEAAAESEVLAALPWIAAAVPLATIAGVLIGALDGVERFDVANGFQALSAVLVQIAPLAAAYAIAPDLQVLIAATVLARAVGVALLLAANLRFVAPGPPTFARYGEARELFGFGAWITVSALLVPFFMSLDKFMIGALAGAAAVTYYAVPDQLVRRISLLPTAVARTLFPRVSAGEATASRELSLKSARLLTGLVTPAVVALCVLMHPFLSIWIDARFADLAAVPGVLLAAGIWLNSLAMIPSAYLQASGRPDLTAKFHLVEILPHAAILWAGVHWFGAVGAAAAMLVVTTLDAVLLMSYGQMPLWRTKYFWQALVWIALACAVGLSGSGGGWWRTAVAVALVGACGIWALRMSPELVNAVPGLRARAARWMPRTMK
jgi:O-antigen/teichoic acid export membrane protein